MANPFEQLCDKVSDSSVEEINAEIERIIQFDPRLLVVRPMYLISAMHSQKVSNKHLNYAVKQYMAQSISTDEIYHVCNIAIDKKDTDLETLMLVEKYYENSRMSSYYLSYLRKKMMEHPNRISSGCLFRQLQTEMSEAYKKSNMKTKQDYFERDYLEEKAKHISDNNVFVVMMKLHLTRYIVKSIVENVSLSIETFEYMQKDKRIKSYLDEYMEKIRNADVLEHIVNKYRKISYLERVIRNVESRQETFDKACLKLAAAKGYDIKWLANHKRCNEVLKHQLLMCLVIEV